jgi:Zn finger protein HypA/HybF involved in hydrogenase expression
MDYTQKTIEGDKTFIEMENIELNSTDRSYYYPSHNTHTIYACPKCGVLQIEI